MIARLIARWEAFLDWWRFGPDPDAPTGVGRKVQRTLTNRARPIPNFPAGWSVERDDPSLTPMLAWTCPGCRKQFRHHDDMRRHIRREHIHEPIRPSPMVPERHR